MRQNTEEGLYYLPFLVPSPSRWPFEVARRHSLAELARVTPQINRTENCDRMNHCLPFSSLDRSAQIARTTPRVSVRCVFLRITHLCLCTLHTEKYAIHKKAMRNIINKSQKETCYWKHLEVIKSTTIKSQSALYLDFRIRKESVRNRIRIVTRSLHHEKSYIK